MTQLQERPVHVMPGAGDDDRPAPLASPVVATMDSGHWRREYVRTPVPPPRGTNKVKRAFRAHPQLVRTLLSTVTVTAGIALLVGAALTFLPAHPWAIADSSNGLSATALTAGDRPSGIAISADARQIYVAAEGGSRLLVLKADDLSLIQSLPVPGLHPGAIAVDAAHQRAYVVDASGHAVRAIDTTTGAVTASFRTGDDPTAVAVDPAHHRLYVANGADKSVWAYSTSSKKRVGTLSTAAKPASLALNTTSKRLYVLAGGKISSYHSSTLQAAGKSRAAAGGSSIAVDSGNRTLLLAGIGTLKRWDLTTGVSSTMPITGSPVAVSGSSATGAAYVAVPDEDRVTRIALR